MKIAIKAFLGLVLSVLISSAAMAEAVKIASGAAGFENIYKKIEVPFEQASGIDLTVEPNGPVEGAKKLDMGAVDGVTVGTDLPTLRGLVAKDGHTMADDSAYKVDIVGKDVIKVLVNKAVNVKALSKEQIKDIFTGKVTNWRDVGGADMDITIVYAQQNEGTNATFKAMMLDNAEYAAERLNVINSVEIRQMLAETEGAVSIGPRSMADDSILAPQIPEVGRNIYFITKAERSPAVQKLVDYINGDGQALIVK